MKVLNSKLETFDWSCLNEGSLDEACVEFTNIFLGMVKSCIPSKTVLVRPDDKPWYDHEIRHFSTKRDRLKKKLIKSDSNYLKEQYKKLRNKVNNLKQKHAKENIYNNLESSIRDFYSTDKKQFWSIMRHFVKNNSNASSIPPLKNNQNTYCYTDLEKTKSLNEFFTSISTINDDNSQLPAFETKCQNKLINIVCTPEEIQSLIEILNSNKANGPDGISNKMFKPRAKEVS